MVKKIDLHEAFCDDRSVIISRKFDDDCGSAEWILSKKIYDLMSADTIKIEQKVKSKMFHDWVVLPFKCLYYRLKGYRNFIFMAENQAMYSFLLNLTRANTTVYFYDLMRIQNQKKGLDYHYFTIVYFLATKSKKILADSYQTADEVTKHYGERISKKIEVVFPYVEKFEVDLSCRRNNVIGYLGALNNRKRPLELIKLAQYIKLKDYDYHVEVWGEGELKEQMLKEIKENNLEKYITLKGHAPEKDKEKIFNSFGYFFCPTEKEGFGLIITEALACNVPVFVYKDAKIPFEVKGECNIVDDFDEMFSVIKYFENLKNVDYDGE